MGKLCSPLPNRHSSSPIWTLLYYERGGVETTGVRSAAVWIPEITTGRPSLPIPSSHYNCLSLDPLGAGPCSLLNVQFRLLLFIHFVIHLFCYSNYRDLRRSWVSDEYGPYIYHFDEFGELIQTIQPPQQAIIPLDSARQLTFVSDSDPVTAQIKGWRD